MPVLCLRIATSNQALHSIVILSLIEYGKPMKGPHRDYHDTPYLSNDGDHKMTSDIHAIFSYAGNKNFGDDYIVSEWIRYSNKNFPNKKLLVSTDTTWLQSNHLNENVIFNSVFPSAIHPFVRKLKENGSTDKL